MKIEMQSAAVVGAEYNDAIMATCQDANNVFTTAGNVRAVFHTHYVNMKTGRHGLETLIAEVLEENNAVFPKNALQDKNMKHIVISCSMFADEIIRQVRAKFPNGSCRYPYASIHHYLSVFLFRKGKIGKVSHSMFSDVGRHCCKSRKKFFLIQ